MKWIHEANRIHLIYDKLTLYQNCALKNPLKFAQIYKKIQEQTVVKNRKSYYVIIRTIVK